MTEHPTFPGRMVNTNSRIAAFLRHAGLKATDVPGEGPWVSMEEAQAEAARRGLVVDLPDPLPPLDPDNARGHVQVMLRLGAHLMRLREGSKTPVEMAWQDAPALTEDEGVAWMLSGNNPGINLRASGSNGWMVLDAENQAATNVLIAAGFVPTAVTAASQDTTSDKFGGSHVYLPIPDDVDPAELQSTLQLPIGDGGLLDILVGTRYVVAPGTRLDSVPGERYRCARDGALLHPEKWSTEGFRWLIDPDAPAPAVPGIEPLIGIARKRRHRRSAAARPDADRITQQVDAIGWEEWIGNDPRIQILGVDGSCGCPVFHWAGASTQRSGILHEGCEFGFGIHIFSGTMISQFGREHASRLDFAAWLRGRENALSELAAEFGVKLNQQVTGFTAADIARWKGAPAAPEFQVISGGGEGGPADEPRPKLASAPFIGTVSGDVPIDGATALDPEPEAPAGETPNGETESEPVEPPEEDTGLAFFRRLAEIDASGFWDSLKFLRQIVRAADSNGVGRWGLLGACLPRVACTVPPQVRLVGASGREGGYNSGASINLNTVLTGPPEEGKSETIKLSQDLIKLPQHAMSITNGTGEGIIKSFCYTKKASDKVKKEDPADPQMPDPQGGAPADPAPPIGSVGGRPGNSGNSGSVGYEVVHITDTVMLTAGEISGLVAEINRQGTKTMQVYRSLWVGEEVGSTTGEVDRRTYLSSHSYRFGAVLGGQIDIDALGAIFDEAKLGSPQRFLFLPVMTTLAVGEQVREIELPFIDWHDGKAPAAWVAGLVDRPEPIWIKRPPAAHEEMEANRLSRRARQHLPYSVAEVRRRAEDEDDIEDVRGHELLHQLKIAAVLAIAEGLRHPTDEHWHAARIIMEVRDLLVQTLMKVLTAQREVQDRKKGRSQGRSQAEARRAEAQDKQEFITSVANRILAIIDEKGAPTSHAEIVRKLSKQQALVVNETLAELVAESVLFVVDYNSKGKGLYWRNR